MEGAQRMHAALLPEPNASTTNKQPVNKTTTTRAPPFQPHTHTLHASTAKTTGASHGQELPPERMEALIRAAGRSPRQRTTLYGAAPPAQTAKSFGAAPLAPAVALPAGAAGAGAGGGSKGRR